MQNHKGKRSWQTGTKESYKVRERKPTALALKSLFEQRNEGPLPILSVDCCDCGHGMEAIVVRLRCQGGGGFRGAEGGVTRGE